MLERARDGLGIVASDHVEAQTRTELRILDRARVVRCADALAAVRSIRWPDAPCERLRKWGRGVGMPDGVVVVGVLRAFLPYAVTWERQGLVCVYAWARTLDGKLAPLAAAGSKSGAQLFREGKAKNAEKLATALVADALDATRAWVERWNRGAVLVAVEVDDGDASDSMGSLATGGTESRNVETEPSTLVFAKKSAVLEANGCEMVDRLGSAPDCGDPSR